MAATNPFRVSDLVAKYGWQAMIYLAALGIKNLAEAQILFVDSAHTDALDADDTEHGHSFEKPLATWDYAIDLCTAGERSVILLAPTHNEQLGDAQVDIDVNDVVTIGIGSGLARPTIDFDHANSSIDIGANNVSIQNVNLLPSITSVAIGVHVETGKTGFRMKDVEFLISEDQSAGEDEFIKAMELTSGNHDCVFEDVIIRADSRASEATHGIHVAAASDRLTFKNVVIDGPYATYGIREEAAGDDHIVEGCSVDVTGGTNYSFNGGSTFAKRTRNLDGGASEDSSENLIGRNDSDNVVDTSAVVADDDGSVLERLEHISVETDKIAAIDNTANLNVAVDGTPTPTAKSVYDIINKDTNYTYAKGTDSLEAIADKLIDTKLAELASVADGTDPRPASVVNDSILAMLMGKHNPASISSFDNETDSLEAISEAVAGISDNVTTAVGTTPTARSLQDILEKDGGGTFVASDDSLEAISDLLRTGTALLTGLNLDHFMKTAVVSEQDMSAEIATGSALAHILVKGAGGDANDFDPTTDSLQAIRDNQLPAATAAIEADDLHHLLTLDGATSPYPENCATDSIIAKLISSSDAADPSTYNCTTDSLQAISDLIRTDTDALAGLQLDHFLANTTGINADSDLEEFCVQKSLMAHICSTSADITTFKPTTDSLQAIGADNDTIITDVGTANTALAALAYLFTLDGAGQAYPINAAEDSILAKMLSKGDPAQLTTYSCVTDSQEMISDKLGAFLGTAGAGATESAKALLELMHTDVDAILADTVVMAERTVVKTDGAVLNGDDDIFDISGGPILVTNLVGIVTTLIGGVVNLSIIETSTQPGGDINLSTVVAIDNDAQGTSYTFTAAVPSVLTPTTAGTFGGVVNPGWLCPIGTIKAKGTGAEDGVIQWCLSYKPLSPSSAVAASA